MLAIKKVVLYKHGVGYFERQGEFDGDQSTDLHFKASEMNDVLKSLTTLDLGGGLISSISYESTKPIEKQLEDIAIRLTDKNSLTGLIAQIKGARVAVELGGTKIEGVVTGIESVSRKEKDAVVESQFLSLLVDGSSLRTYDLLEVKSLTLLDDGLKKDLQHLLDILISAKKKDLKKLTIFGKGKGKRDILASYTVETPVWKTSYRVLLSEKKPLIQGWALVDNTQDEDWENVVLTLVAGLPVSFVHDLYSPRYKRRPVVRVQEEEAYAPPMLEDALPPPAAAGMADDFDEEGEEMMAEESTRFGVGAVRKMKAAPMRSRAEARASSVKVQTRTVEVGDLFQYRIDNPVTVKRNQSALVPILQGGFEGKRVAIYNPELREKNPMTAVLFRNTTGMTLEGGPLTVLEDENYVGESMLETLKPDEERIVPYSVELGCVVALDHKSELRSVHSARIANGTLVLHRYRVGKAIYHVENKTDRPIDLYLEHRFQKGWDLVETEKPVETTENFYRFRFDVPAKKTVTFVVSEKGDESQSFALTEVKPNQVRAWFESRYIDEATRKVLEGVMGLQARIVTLRRKSAAREKDVAEIFKNQERVRKNLQSVGTSQAEKSLRERYIKEMTQEEDRLKEYRAEIDALRTEEDKLSDELRAKISGLRFETKF